MTKVLILGKNGLLGNSLIELFQKESCFELLSLSRDDLDISKKDKVFSVVKTFEPSIIINAAAYTHVDSAEEEVDKAIRANSTGPRYLSKAARMVNATFIHISTDYVFDGIKGLYSEEDDTNPLNIYGKTKLDGEKVITSIHDKSIIIRTSWMFGRNGSNFVKTILKLAKTSSVLRVVEDQIGGPTYVDDISNAILKIVRSIVTNKPDIRYGIYHFTGTPYVSWFTFAKNILEEAKRHNVIHNIPIIEPIKSSEFSTKALRPLNTSLNLLKIQREFNISPSDWRLGLNMFMNFYSNQKNYIEDE